MTEEQLPFGRLPQADDDSNTRYRSCAKDEPGDLPFGRLVDDGSFTIATLRPLNPPTTTPDRPISKWMLALGVGLLALFSSFFVWRVATFYVQCRQLHAGLGATYLGGVAILTISLLYLVLRTWRRYRGLLEIERIKQLTRAVRMSRESHRERRQLSNEIEQYLGRLDTVGATYDGGLPEAIGRLRDKLGEHDEPLRALEQLEEYVLTRIDAEVELAIERRAVETAAATALASGVLDALILCVQTVRLVGEIAGRYGSRPGWLGTARLLRRGITMALFAEVTEQATELLAEAAANKTAAAVGGRLAQGISNGLLVLRFGDAVKRQCRPITCPSSPSALGNFITAVWNLTIGRTVQSPRAVL